MNMLLLILSLLDVTVALADDFELAYMDDRSEDTFKEISISTGGTTQSAFAKYSIMNNSNAVEEQSKNLLNLRIQALDKHHKMITANDSGGMGKIEIVLTAGLRPCADEPAVDKNGEPGQDKEQCQEAESSADRRAQKKWDAKHLFYGEVQMGKFVRKKLKCRLDMVSKFDQ